MSFLCLYTLLSQYFGFSFILVDVDMLSVPLSNILLAGGQLMPFLLRETCAFGCLNILFVGVEQLELGSDAELYSILLSLLHYWIFSSALFSVACCKSPFVRLAGLKVELDFQIPSAIHTRLILWATGIVSRQDIFLVKMVLVLCKNSLV